MDRALETISRKATLIESVQIREHLCNRVAMLQHLHSCRTPMRRASLTSLSRMAQAQRRRQQQIAEVTIRNQHLSHQSNLHNSNQEASQKWRNEDLLLGQSNSPKQTILPKIRISNKVKADYCRIILWLQRHNSNNNNNSSSQYLSRSSSSRSWLANLMMSLPSCKSIRVRIGCAMVSQKLAKIPLLKIKTIHIITNRWMDRLASRISRLTTNP